jgi:NADPH2:quinone reductase
VVGFASGDIPRIPLNLPLLKGCAIVGVMFSRFAENCPSAQRQNMLQVLEWCAQGRVQPHVGQSFMLAETARALQMIDARKAVGKLLVRP